MDHSFGVEVAATTVVAIAGADHIFHGEAAGVAALKRLPVVPA